MEVGNFFFLLNKERVQSMSRNISIPLGVLFLFFLAFAACGGGSALSQGTGQQAQSQETAPAVPTPTAILVLAPTAEPAQTALPLPDIPQFLSVKITFVPAWVAPQDTGDRFCAKVGEGFELQFEPTAPEGWKASGPTRQQYALQGITSEGKLQIHNEGQWMTHTLLPGEEVVEPDGLGAKLESLSALNYVVDYFGVGFPQLVYQGPGQEEGPYCFSLPDSKGIVLDQVTRD